MSRRCGCGNPLPPYSGQGRPRTKCEHCRQPRSGTVVLVPRVVADEAPIVRVTRRALEQAGRLDTPDGTAAMELATSIAAGGHTGAALASLSKEYRQAMRDAQAGAQGAADAVSDLGSARRARIAGA
jgi:hypothetical protein